MPAGSGSGNGAVVASPPPLSPPAPPPAVTVFKVSLTVGGFTMAEVTANYTKFETTMTNALATGLNVTANRINILSVTADASRRQLSERRQLAGGVVIDFEIWPNMDSSAPADTIDFSSAATVDTYLTTKADDILSSMQAEVVKSYPTVTITATFAAVEVETVQYHAAVAALAGDFPMPPPATPPSTPPSPPPVETGASGPALCWVSPPLTPAGYAATTTSSKADAELLAGVQSASAIIDRQNIGIYTGHERCSGKLGIFGFSNLDDVPHTNGEPKTQAICESLEFDGVGVENLVDPGTSCCKYNPTHTGDEFKCESEVGYGSCNGQDVDSGFTLCPEGCAYANAVTEDQNGDKASTCFYMCHNSTAKEAWESLGIEGLTYTQVVTDIEATGRALLDVGSLKCPLGYCQDGVEGELSHMDDNNDGYYEYYSYGTDKTVRAKLACFLAKEKSAAAKALEALGKAAAAAAAAIGGIIGGSVGGAVGALVIGVAIFWYCRKKKSGQDQESTQHV